VKMTAELAALREQIATGREYRGQKRRSIGAWISWVIWFSLRHLLVDLLVLGVVLVWARRRGERRLEDLCREWLRGVRGVVRRWVPGRAGR